MTVSIIPEDLADYLRRHEEDYGAFDPTEDGVIEDQPHHGHATSDTSEDLVKSDNQAQDQMQRQR